MSARSLTELAALCGATVEGDGARLVVGPAALGEAGPEHVSFLANPRYVPELARTRAAGVLVGPDVERPRSDLCLLRCADPNSAFTEVVRAFAGDELPEPPGVHPTAVVPASCELGEDVAIGAGCVLGEGARIGRGARLGPRVVVGRGASVGPESVLHAGVVLYAGVSVGARCVLHSGCVVGADGFGFDPTPSGWVKVPQCGTVVIEDDVEIGANSAIDRGRFGATRVGRGVKIDNLVQVGHNVVIGPGALLCGQVGVAGSARIGAGVVIGGQAGIGGHLEIGPRARVAAQAGVYGDLAGGAEYLGHPARPRAEALRILAAQGRLERLVERLRALEKRVAELDPRPPSAPGE